MASIQNVIDYVASWRTENGIPEGIDLTIEQLTKLAKDVQSKIGELSFKALVEGANIITYNGYMGDTAAWEFAKAASENSGGAYCYISDIEAGELLRSKGFREALNTATGDVNLAKNLIEGTVENGTRTPFGTGDVLSVNDFMSRNAMLANAHG